ncbi:MAG: hypothetical protein ACWIPH_08820 [Ostreibacterium sp.]
MIFIEHAVNWVNGEIVEGIAIGSFGVLLLIVAAVFWKFGDTANAKAMILPFFVVGLFFSISSVVGVYNNIRRIPAFTEAYHQDEPDFIEKEKARVEGFMHWYVYTFVTGSVLIILGLAAFLLLGSPNFKAIGLTCIILGTALLFIDYFSKERAIEYLQRIDTAT